MTEEEIIASGLLELYVTGSLSAEDSMEVEKAMAQFPSIKEEIEKIEATLIGLSEAGGQEASESVWKNISLATENIRTLHTAPKTRNWSSITGWAAAVIFMMGLGFMIKQNSDLKGKIRNINTKNVVLKERVLNSEIELAEATDLLEIVRSKDYKSVTLPGNQAVAPEAYATVYYNEDTHVAYIDAKGLPSPPAGKVYQVWSLKMNPLTPSSIGLLEDMETSERAFFKVENVPSPEAFGITLEPEGGSESPTLDQLYTLGMVSP
ncbi:MAG: anti-sigma factor [Bacteroidota bacterium]